MNYVYVIKSIADGVIPNNKLYVNKEDAHKAAKELSAGGDILDYYVAALELVDNWWTKP